MNTHDTQHITESMPAVMREAMSRAAVDRFAAQLPEPYVGPDTTDIQAGFALGVQFVLHRLRANAV